MRARYNKHVQYDLCPPIDGNDIPNFREWVKWNGFYSQHPAFDFAAYMEWQGNCVLGLPEKTPVRAVADGVVRKIDSPHRGINHGYTRDIIIEHQAPFLISGYTHVVPCTEIGQSVKKGDTIATLYKDPKGLSGRLVHLHFYLTRSPAYLEGELDKYLIDPEKILGKVADLVASPQREQSFSIPKLKKRQPAIHVRNFGVLRIGDIDDYLF